MFAPHQRHYAAAFFLDFAFMAGVTAAPFYILHQLHEGPRVLGLVSGAQSACYASVCLLSSALVTRARNGLALAVVGSAIFSILFPLGILIKSPYWLASMGILSMVGMALFWPAMQSWLGGEPDPDIRSRRIGKYNIAWNLGLGLGAFSGGWLYEQAYWLPFLVVFLTGMIAPLLAATLPHERVQHSRDESLEAGREQLADPQSEAQLYCAWAANFVGFALVNVLRAIFPKRMDELVQSGQLTTGLPFGAGHLESASTAFAVLALTLYVAYGAVSYALGSTSFWKSRIWLLALLQLLAAAAFFVLGRAANLMVMELCFVIVGVCGAFMFFASLSFSISNPRYKHRRAAIHEGMVGLGGLTGAVVFGELAEQYGTQWPFQYTPFMVLAALAVQVALLSYGRRRAARLQASS